MFKISQSLINRGASIRSVSIRAAVVNTAEDHLRPWQDIPGPLSLPIIGQILHFLPGGWLYKRTVELQELLYKNYGPIVRIDGSFGLDPIIFIYDPEAAINLFRKEDQDLMPHRPGFDSIAYYREKVYNQNKDDPIGLIIDNGERWKKMRFSINQVMLKTKMIKLYGNTMEEVAVDMIDRIRSIRNEDNTLKNNIFTELNLWALESVGVVALGGRLNCFDPNLPDDSPAKKLIKTIHDVLAVSEKLDFQPSLWKYFSTSTYKKGMKLYEEHMKLNEYFVDKASDELKSTGEKDYKDKSVLEKVLDIDRKIALATAHDMLFAGVDTAGSTVLALLYLLATNEEKQEKLREEVLSKREKRPYIRACIKESLRLYPIIGGNFRRTTKEHEILGYRIPKDINIVVGNQHLCRMDEQFPRANEFIPERWIVDKSDPLHYGQAHPFSYTPFGFGLRGCVGRRIAELELETFVTKIMENFKLEWSGPPPKRIRSSSLFYFTGPFNFIIKDL
ncbi:cytochrome P450 CYP12A2-like [Bicyclus anynana]|uniref:Cytochrome P450 CYP12A2-like n=1 Tax=Bicyclus anynana TaxID=110368 RepID=A0A6J1NHY4_BICAN|nr:cytochrome P450 CYP12A2-like [Bicyclus anynana]XP_052737945.1 cytochrome P450 CYP12A2-like [Bicyclus anynana]